MAKFRLLPTLAVFVFFAFSAQASQTLILGHNSPPDGPHSIGAKIFAAELERLLPGRFRIDEKGGVTLGPEPDLWDAIRLGTIDLALITSISLAPQVPEIEILNLPFLFRDSDHAAKVLDGPIGQSLEAKLGKAGVVVLAWGELGFRHITTSGRPVRVPSDLAGLKIRIVPNPIYRQTFLALGADPVEMFLPDLYNALKEGVVDGEENPLLVFRANHLDDVQKYVSLTRHFYNPLIFMMNTDAFAALTGKEQAAIRAAAKAGAAATRDAVARYESRAIAALRSRGVEVIDTVDRDAFEKALAPLEPTFDKMFGAEQLQRIRETR
ncbi:DctP family TRAP transporter solute-binding subunit [Telmatospirillum sp.]|uniref:DctP family TRAP transporter solute-binding subunit n=1 Tax=Telmatospirillum sp. TaxID=2079197 RepID=UPI00283C081E|nr:DctP family TRAP transporter solute-binding subunit [Telmatospirillum sp.]MDR3436145.1 DctP family TRAP transporter solute-binding subunit [Telmatospirillum sp.]